MINLKGGGQGDGTLTMQEHIDAYCETGTQKMSTQIPINRIVNLILKVIILIVS